MNSRSIASLVAAALFSLSISSSSLQAQTDPPNGSMSLEEMRTRLEKQLQSLDSDNNRLSNRVGAVRELKPSSPTNNRSRLNVFDHFEASLRKRKQYQAERKARLEQQLRELEQLIELHQRQQAEMLKARMKAQAEESSADGAPQQTELIPSENQSADSIPGVGPTGNPAQSAATVEDVATITDSAFVDAADRLPLANNLFGAGHVNLAIEMYKQIDMSQLSQPDRLWTETQIAACYRRLGQTAEAEKHYRNVAGVSTPSTYVDISRWWLDTIQRQKDLSARGQAIRTQLDHLEGQFHAASTK